MCVSVPQGSLRISVYFTLLYIVKAASTTQREIMYLICECYLLVFLTEQSIRGDVLYHIVLFNISVP